MSVGGDLGRLEVNGTLRGNVHIAGTIGSVEITQNLGERDEETGQVNGSLVIDEYVAAGTEPRIQIGSTGGGLVGDLLLNGGLGGALRIEGAITEDGNVHISGGVGDTGQVQTGAVLGTLQVDGGIGAGTDPNEPRIQIDGAIGDATANALVHLTADGLHGLLDVAGGIGSNATLDIHGGLDDLGRVRIGSTVVGDLVTHGTIAPDVDPNDPRVSIDSEVTGTVQVHGELGGGVQVTGDLNRGTLQINGDLADSGRVLIGGNMAGYLNVAAQNGGSGTVHGDVLIAGDLAGRLDIAGTLGDPNQPGVGHIRVNGGFAQRRAGEEPLLPEAPLIRIHEFCEDRAGRYIGVGSDITIDFDGWDDGDDWGAAASIVIGPEPSRTYLENTPGERLYEITPCKGDMNNDGVTNFADINPFTLALSNPDTYASTYPGLGGSRVYHGDINEDGLFNFGDINPFVALLSDPNNPCAAAQEGGGEGGGEMMMMELPEDGGEANATPEGMAAGLANIVPPEGYADLLGLVDFAIQNAPDETQAAYWLAVYGALTE